MGWLLYGGTLLPVIGLVQVGGQAHADRYTYLPQIGIYVGLIWLAAELRLHLRAAELVKLRYFVGLTNEESAKLLGISARSAKYCWTHARAWLYQEISASQNRPEPVGAV